MIREILKKAGFSVFILSICFSLAFTNPMQSYLQLELGSLNYGHVETRTSTEFVDAPTAQIADYATELANAYAAGLSPSELQNTIIKVTTGFGCDATACVTITRQEDGYKTVETIKFASGLQGGSSGASYGKSGSASDKGSKGPKGPSPAAVAAYNSAVSALNSANSDLATANAGLQAAANAVESANRDLESAKSDAQTAENALNAAISEYNTAANAAEMQAIATLAAQQKASNSATQKNRIEKDLKQKAAELEAKKKTLEASKNKLAAGKQAARDQVAQLAEKGIKPTEKAKGDSTKATAESVATHNKAAEGVTKALDLEKSAGTIDTKKLLASLDGSQIPTHTGKLADPMKGSDWCVYSPVGKRPTSSNPNRMHEGLDLSRVTEGTPIYSPISGVVSNVSYEKLNFGQSVEILTTMNGKTHYAVLGHMVKGSPEVKIGQVIRPGDLLGKVGTTGGGGRVPPHLHLELRDCSDRGLAHCTVKMDTRKIIVDPEPLLENAERCPGR